MSANYAAAPSNWTVSPYSRIGKALTLIALLLCLCAEARAEDFYLLSATPTSKLSYGFPARLYRFSMADGQLKQDRVVCEAVDFVNSYQEAGLITVGLLGGRTTVLIDIKDPSKKTFVRWSDPIVVKSFFIDHDAKIFHAAPTAPIGLSNPARLVGAPIDSGTGLGSEVELDSKLRAQFVSDGQAGGFGDLQQGMYGALVKGRPMSMRTYPFNWSPPPEWLMSAEETTFEIFAVTSRYVVVSREKQDVDLTGQWGSRTAWVLDKSSQRWSRMDVPGATLWPRVFGDWIAFIATGDLKLPQLPQRRTQYSEASDKLAPRDVEPRIRRSGTLILWNPKTASRFTIETGADDCEVLFVKDRDVYYRTGDEIRLVTLSSDRQIKTGQLILKSPEIEQVHWMFPAL